MICLRKVALGPEDSVSNVPLIGRPELRTLNWLCREEVMSHRFHRVLHHGIGDDFFEVLQHIFCVRYRVLLGEFPQIVASATSNINDEGTALEAFD